ncbi:MAG: hypothetical protein IT363_00370 [Methanoregulaceae archaeon]|nr:hypothetical protein [Methanoregulaceae archaeon]
MNRDLWLYALEYLGRVNAARKGALERLADRFGIDYVCAAICRSEASFDQWLDRAITLPLVSRREQVTTLDVHEFVVGLQTLATQH